MINSRRGCIAHNYLWPWPISSRSFSHDFAKNLLKYGTSCCVHSTARIFLDGLFLYWAQMITSIRGCITHNYLWPWPISSTSSSHDFAKNFAKIWHMLFSPGSQEQDGSPPQRAVRYLSSATIHINLQSGTTQGKIYPPYLELTYSVVSRDDYNTGRKMPVCLCVRVLVRVVYVCVCVCRQECFAWSFASVLLLMHQTYWLIMNMLNHCPQAYVAVILNQSFSKSC